MDNKKSIFLFIIILISGYASLALELLAIRQLVPYLGSDTIITSIVIGIVLIFLSIGYYRSGKINIKKSSIRDKIVNNFVIATCFIFISTTYVFLDNYFKFFEFIGITNRILKAFSFSILFLSVPSYLLAQTTPLISNYFSKNISGKSTGIILMFGTFGSFAGSLFTTLFIMPVFGVNYAVMFNVFLMTVAILLLNRRNRIEIYILTFLSIILTFMFNNSILEKKLGILVNNEFSTIKVAATDNGDSKIMIVNNSYASKISKNEVLMFDYVKYIEQNFINYLPKSGEKKDVLILGAGGFTMGIKDEYNNYTFVDINKALLGVSEKYFLEKKLSGNKQYIVSDARAFLKQNSKKYDLIILDTYSYSTEIPTHLITEEYFLSVKNSLKNNGVMVANIIMMPNFNDKFSIKIDNTIQSVFKNVQRQVIGNFNPWGEAGQNANSNVIYAYFNSNFKTDKTYTDNNNSFSIDSF